MRDGWDNKKFGDVCTLDRSHNKGKALPYVGLEDIVSGEGKFTGSVEPKKVQGSSFKFTPDHVLYGRLRPYLNKVFLPNFEGHCSTEIFPIRPAPNVDRRYLYYWLSMEATVNKIDGTSTGARMPRANMDAVLELPISVPSLPEQQRIVAVLDETFAGLTTATVNAEKNLKSARELFDSYVHSVFERNYGWPKVLLRDVTEKITKGSSPKWQGIHYVDVPGVLFVTSENVGANRLIMDERKYVEDRFNEKDKKSILKKGDVLTNIVGASIGRTAIYNLDEVANINQAVCLIRCGDKLNNRYLCYMLNSHTLRQFLHDNETNNARANLSLGFFAGLQIPLPPMSEQLGLVHQFDAMADLVSNLQSIYLKKLSFIRELKQSLMQKAFSGELTSPPSQVNQQAAE